MRLIPRLPDREMAAEQMDEPDLNPVLHRQALRGLARLNRFGGAASLIWPEIKKVLGRFPRSPVTMLDVATGSGDVPISLARKLLRSGYSSQVTGLDYSPVAIEEAQKRAKELNLQADFISFDVLRDPLPGQFDIVVCSLFLHHLSEDQIVNLLRKMREATRKILIVSDLDRSGLNLRLVQLAGRMLSRSAIVHNDGELSVKAAFTVTEANDFARKSELPNAIIRKRFPCRWVLTWRRED
ncbi:methyltransferase domain-containing protein [Telmatocola sphagniphila]|jgi:2-polyprenyl-3-methyl-5-hydroxy-6-metoxy-1,4-benzoquinol methylase|uniref:Methyltransferase domain-containing protein n=1 Tax=Telmatocola sphagniphila TaxID=1123043 RepID=A0A8E6BB26_9BACT|nr:methyltransferase domain-containing protein [Telmatocola sphagniphila]QVL34584.1 methyltransferase domain-containing protein [Telmatocola sphagniphila]